LISTLRWEGDATTGYLKLLDQTLLPTQALEIDCRDVPAVWEAIKSLRVRGAPAIGVAAAYGAVLGARTDGYDKTSTVLKALKNAIASLKTSRPTAVNLFWALDRMDRCAQSAQPRDGLALLETLLAMAQL
jgi:methylthioribose-1-phosphate isomerase